MKPSIFQLYEFSVLRYYRDTLQHSEHTMSFARAQERWEQSWIYGPPDDPADDPRVMEYIDALANMTDEELHQELISVRRQIRFPDECCKMDNLRASEAWIADEIRARDEAACHA